MRKEKEADKISTDEYFNFLIDTYQNLVFSVCYNIVNDYFDAQDLTQDTFLSAYQNLPSFDGNYEKAWLCRIATNKSLDFSKHSERRSSPTDQEYFRYQEDQKNPTPEEKTLNKMVREQLLTSCKKLKPPYKEISIDYFYNELSPAEIASKDGKNIKTVQTQIYRARAMLRKIYAKEAD